MDMTYSTFSVALELAEQRRQELTAQADAWRLARVARPAPQTRSRAPRRTFVLRRPRRLPAV